jgi:probable addiction module antidote protein
MAMATKRQGRKPAAKKSASTSRVTFSKWDVADYLRTDADVVAYFEACIEEAGDDPSFIAAALGDIVRARGMSRVARDVGLTREGLYRALSKDANPSLGTVLKVTRALGLKLRVEVANTG